MNRQQPSISGTRESINLWRMTNAEIIASTDQWIQSDLHSEFYDDEADNAGQCLPAEWFQDENENDSGHSQMGSDVWTEINRDIRERLAMDKSKLMKSLQVRFASLSNDLLQQINRKWMKQASRKKNPRQFEKLLNTCMPTLGVLNPAILHYAKRFTPHTQAKHRTSILKRKNCAIENRFRMEAINTANQRREMSKKLFHILSIDNWEIESVAALIFSEDTASREERLELSSRLLDALHMSVRDRLKTFNACALHLSETKLKKFFDTFIGKVEASVLIWKPLKYPDSIRCFTLGADEKGSLQFRLFETRLSKPVKYKALSYVWGDGSDVAVIDSPRGQCKLRKNLYEFLKSMVDRQMTTDTYFWVDALCIDQASVEEKNQQVQQIEKTFKQATEVIAWVGSQSLGVLDLFYNGDVPYPRWDLLLSHAYWNRVWIVQEVITATNLLFLDESHSIDSRHLIKMRTAWSITLKGTGQERPSNMASAGFKHLERIEDAMSSEIPYMMDSLLNARYNSIHHKRQNDQALVDVISKYQNQGCTNIRDRVYALVSLSTLKNELKIDYNITLGQLFWRVLCTSSRTISLPTAYSVMRALNLELGDLVPWFRQLSSSQDTSGKATAQTLITLEEWQDVKNITVFGGHASVIIKTITAINISDGRMIVSSYRTGLLSTTYLILDGTVEKGDCILSLSGSDLSIVVRQRESHHDSSSYLFDAVGFAAEQRQYEKLRDSFLEQKLQLKHFFPLKYGQCTGDKVWIDVPILWLLLILNAPNDLTWDWTLSRAMTFPQAFDAL